MGQPAAASRPGRQALAQLRIAKTARRFLPPAPERHLFAICLIAAKPLKPCDGAVFWALNLLLKMKRNASETGASSGPQRKETGLGGMRFRALRPRAANLLAAWPIAACPFLLPSASCKPSFFCSCFDSNKARQTVRWGHFWSLLFALVFVVAPGRCLRLRADFGQVLG